MPKIIAMIINNEKQYATSEKSGRYTRMDISPSEKLIYEKWVDIFRSRIEKKYKEKFKAALLHGTGRKLFLIWIAIWIICLQRNRKKD